MQLVQLKLTALRSFHTLVYLCTNIFTHAFLYRYVSDYKYVQIFIKFIYDIIYFITYLIRAEAICEVQIPYSR